MRRTLALIFSAAGMVAACTGQDTGSLTEQAAAIDEDLGDGWDTQVVEDPIEGRYVLASPSDEAVWTIGTPIVALAEATAGTAWAAFWLPVVEATTVDGSNIRAVVADTRSVPGNVVSWQVNVNADDAGLDLETEQLAADLRTRFTDQGLEVTEARTTTWNDRDIVLVAFVVPAEVFGEEARYVRQWFIPEHEPAAMWSFSCDAPADPDLTAELCRTGLDGFRSAGGAAEDPGAAI